MASKIAQRPSRTLTRTLWVASMGPRTAREPPRAVQESSKSVPKPSKRRPRAPRNRPRAPKSHPGCGHGAHYKTAKENPQTTKNSHKTAQERPPRRTKRYQNDARKAKKALDSNTSLDIYLNMLSVLSLSGLGAMLGPKMEPGRLQNRCQNRMVFKVLKKCPSEGL